MKTYPTSRLLCRNSSYDAPTYLWFRDCDLLTAALEFARSFRLAALSTLVTLHRDELGTYQSQILDAIPEVVDPLLYADLLPIATQPVIDLTWGSEDDVQDADHEAIVGWYCRRARQLDERAGQLRHARTLLDLGMNKLADVCGEQALLPLRALLLRATELVTLVFDSADHGLNTSQLVTLAEWEGCSFQDKVCKMLEGCTAETIVASVRNVKCVPLSLLR